MCHRYHRHFQTLCPSVNWTHRSRSRQRLPSNHNWTKKPAKFWAATNFLKPSWLSKMLGLQVVLHLRGGRTETTLTRSYVSWKITWWAMKTSFTKYSISSHATRWGKTQQWYILLNFRDWQGHVTSETWRRNKWYTTDLFAVFRPTCYEGDFCTKRSYLWTLHRHAKCWSTFKRLYKTRLQSSS